MVSFISLGYEQYMILGNHLAINVTELISNIKYQQRINNSFALDLYPGYE